MAKRIGSLFGVLLIVLAPGVSSAQTAADCDFDGSGMVDFRDFLAFATAYSSTSAKHDLNDSGQVDFLDFLVFARFYGQGVTATRDTTVTLTGDVTMDFVHIDPGTVTMGSPDSEEERWADEGPQHEVTISKGFYLGKYEVTQGQWEAVMGTTPWSGESNVEENADHPAVYVSWEDAQAFIQKLNDAAGKELYRLPTEAEWEYACRAGTTTRWSFGDDESDVGDYAWYEDNAWDAGEPYAHEVGTKLANPWGLYDMHGNVFEWCLDWYGSYSSEAQTDPSGPESGSYRVLRGGSWINTSYIVRCSYRPYSHPELRTFNYGFRCARAE